MHRLEFFDDPRAFLEQASEHLAADPVVGTVVATVTQRAVAEDAAGVPVPEDLDRWWLVVRDATGAVVGAGMRTAPFAPYPLFLLPMPDDAAAQVGRALLERPAPVTAVNGALPAARLCAEEVALVTGGRVVVAEHLRLFELAELVAQEPVPGRLVAATEEDVDLALAWYDAFAVDADLQAGREPGPDPLRHDRPGMERRVADGAVWFWEDRDGRQVHVTGFNPPAFGVARIGPVFTPAEHRGRGYAGAAVSAVSQRLRDAGARVVLYTDQANPVSNGLYLRLGFRPVVDQANLEIDPEP